MSDLDRREAEQRLWEAIDDTRIGMLGLHEPGQHMQPMTAFCEPETNSIWFFTRRTPDLARAAAAITPAQQARIARGAQAFLAGRADLARCSLRFDAVLVTPWALPRHICDAWRMDA